MFSLFRCQRDSNTCSYFPGEWPNDQAVDVSGMGLNYVFGTPHDEAVAFHIKELKICWPRENCWGIRKGMEDLQSEKIFQSSA